MKGNLEPHKRNRVKIEASIIDVSTLKGVLKTMDECYRLGIIDAHLMKDVVDLSNFLDKTTDPKKFFLATNPKQQLDWREWKAKVVFMAERRHVRPLIFFGISNTYHYLFSLLSIAYEYYRTGIEHATQQFNSRRLADITAPYKNKYTHAYIQWGVDKVDTNKIPYAKSVFETKCYALQERERQIYKVSKYSSIIRLIDKWSEEYYLECRNRINKPNASTTRKTKK